MLRRPPRSTLFPTRRSSDLEGQLLTLVEVARRQMLMGHDGRVELGVGADLGVVRVGAGLLAARARNRVEIGVDRKSTRLNSSHANISYAVFCLKKKKKKKNI